MLVPIALLRLAVLALNFQAANHILKRPTQWGWIKHGLATIGASVASNLGVGQASEAINVSVCARRRWLVVNVEAKRTGQVIVHRLAHGTCTPWFWDIALLDRRPDSYSQPLAEESTGIRCAPSPPPAGAGLKACRVDVCYFLQPQVEG